jgi:hypothetical protein
MRAVRPGRPTQVGNPTAAPVRHGRLRDAAAKRGVPQATILVTVAVVVLTHLAGKLAYRIRDVFADDRGRGVPQPDPQSLVVALQR